MQGAEWDKLGPGGGQGLGEGAGVGLCLFLVAALPGAEDEVVLLRLGKGLFVHEAGLGQVGEGGIAEHEVVLGAAQKAAHVVQAGQADGTAEHLRAAQAAVDGLTGTGVHADAPDELAFLGLVQFPDVGGQLGGQVVEILFLGPAAGRSIPGQQALGVDAVGGKELEFAAAQQGSHCFGHPVVFPIVETAPAGGQGQHRHTGRAIDLELHFAAEHPAPLFIIGTLHHESILLNLYELIPHRVVSIPGGSERCAQRGLVLVQVVAQCVEAGVEVAQLQVHHAQKHDGVMGQSHLKNLLLENKKAGHSTK